MRLIRPALLEHLLPRAIAWAEQQELRIGRAGVPLTAAQLVDARQLGLANPAAVRLLAVPRVPLPEDPELRQAAQATGLITEATVGLALRYGIFIRADYLTERALIAHELVHTRQYERLGGLAPFLAAYLRECILPPGYPHGPLEQEAIRVARDLAPTIPT